MTDKTRDHLANERTFLAWVRTALGLIGLGFVLARMGLFLRQIALTTTAEGLRGADLARGMHAGHEFVVSGVVFLVVGTALGGWSGWLYERNRRSIDAERFEPARWSVVALTGVVVAGSLGILGLVLWRVVATGGG